MLQNRLKPASTDPNGGQSYLDLLALAHNSVYHLFLLPRSFTICSSIMGGINVLHLMGKLAAAWAPAVSEGSGNEPRSATSSYIRAFIAVSFVLLHISRVE
jgi:hypothetical protein